MALKYIQGLPTCCGELIPPALGEYICPTCNMTHNMRAIKDDMERRQIARHLERIAGIGRNGKRIRRNSTGVSPEFHRSFTGMKVEEADV